VTRRARVRLALLVGALFLAPAAQARDGAWVTRWYPFDLRGGHIHVPVRVAGVETVAMFDTGASVHVLDRAFALQHGIPFSFASAVEVQSGNSRERLPVARNVPIELFGAPAKLRLVPVSEVGYAKLVIGTGVLSSFVMQIDYANSRIRFASFEAVKLKELANVELRRASASDLPAVRATVDGQDVWLLLDTGFTGPLILTPRFVRSRGWEEDAGSISVDAFGAVAAMRRHRVPVLQLGPYELRGVVSATPAEGRLPSALTATELGRVRISGILGAGVLKHFLVTLDLAHMRAHLAHAPKPETESWESSVSADDPPPEDTALPGTGAAPAGD
jgi:hypothetical protein